MNEAVFRRGCRDGIDRAARTMIDPEYDRGYLLGPRAIDMLVAEERYQERRERERRERSRSDADELPGRLQARSEREVDG